jgi:hypothetical protein
MMKERMIDAKRVRSAVLAAACACAAMTAYGQESMGATSGMSAAPASEVGHATRAWLALQRDNTAAGPAMPVLGAEAGIAYQRYLNSFKTPIPSAYGSMMDGDGNGASHSGQGGGTPASPAGAY